MDVSLDQAETLVAACRGVVAAATRRLAADSAREGRVDLGLLDREQVLAYDLSTVASKVAAAEEMVVYGRAGDFERLLAVTFAGEVAADLAGRVQGREQAWGADGWQTAQVRAALQAARSTALAEEVGRRLLEGADPPRHLSEELEMVRQTFRDYAEAKVAPVAEHVHRNDADIPEEIIADLAGMGCFGLSIPEEYGGFAQGSSGDVQSMVVVTEELSRGSLGVAGSLITRPEILSKALLKGGTAEQRRRWLPAIASGEAMCAVAVTEPDHGSDVANLKTSATRQGDVYVVNGTKTWCTFAGRADLLMLLARTDPDPTRRHRGLSLFVVEKPPCPGHEFTHSGQLGGKLVARAIGTIGYRGMHSFELSFEDYAVPATNLVGGDDGLGRGFYLQMDAFANGRLQTAARALGVMQAACDAAVAYANDRQVFGRPLGAYQLTRGKLARMAWLIAACRRFSFRTAELLGEG
ncbi:MAG TPA: acyl-CoA dehydrogenase family protein, partial [Egibacteraceae bacterium]|nr:acyl-CoA dehydrogenase family protein [Egibacteraceae bacterium]